MKKKLVILTGSGISAESGIPTFRASTDALWENYDVKTVCTHNAWLLNSDHVNGFYNMLRVKYKDIQPNLAHKLIKELESDFDVSVVTQNVDNLHEKAGSSKVLHLHGELMKCCSEDDPENKEFWVELPKEGFGESGLEIPEGELAGDGSQLRPYIVFFEEPVPNMKYAIEEVENADILLVIGTSLSVYPAAGLLEYYDVTKPLYIIDPWEDIKLQLTSKTIIQANHICKGASEGMKEFVEIIKKVKD